MISPFKEKPFSFVRPYHQLNLRRCDMQVIQKAFIHNIKFRTLIQDEVQKDRFINNLPSSIIKNKVFRGLRKLHIIYMTEDKSLKYLFAFIRNSYCLKRLELKLYNCKRVQ